MARFVAVLPEHVHLLPEIVKIWLKKALDRTPANELSLKDIMDEATASNGLIYLVYNSELTGVAYYVLGARNGQCSLHYESYWMQDNEDYMVLNIVLVGGKNLNKWAKELHDFSITLGKSIGCSEILIMGRNGWGKIFPDLKLIGAIYSYPLHQ